VCNPGHYMFDRFYILCFPMCSYIFIYFGWRVHIVTPKEWHSVNGQPWGIYVHIFSLR
jgi:hypothetical protein